MGEPLKRHYFAFFSFSPSFLGGDKVGFPIVVALNVITGSSLMFPLGYSGT